MRTEDVPRFTADQRAELDAGFLSILADKDARTIEGALPGLLATCADKVPEIEAVHGWKADAPRTRVGSNPAMQGPVRRVRKRRSATRRAYDYVASFTGPLTIIMISGSIGLFLGATLVMRR
ncbi:hypothetical protein ACFY04_25975 [Streptomyces sp. NPDC001549]|uniref:hypothetical protein n=1 Tax=Streptomyces sp. NPDC001549 TaxID=3364586 RepID=UPI0036928CC2